MPDAAYKQICCFPGSLPSSKPYAFKRIIEMILSDKPDISAIILTFNEEIHIARCIERLKPIVRDVYVVDSFSTDATVAIAKQLGAIVFQNPFVNQADQFQWALNHCPIKTAWVMRMDADEYLEEALLDEIKQKWPTLPHDITGVCLKRKHIFLGKTIRHGDRYPLVMLRIWRLGMAHIEQRWMDEHIVLDQGGSITLEHDFVDENLNSIQWFIDKHNRYASREMLDIIGQKYRLFESNEKLMQSDTRQAKLKRWVKERVYNRLPIFVRPWLYFFYRYFIRLGFLDGKEGFAYHFMQGLWYRCLVDLKVFEAEKVIKGAATNQEIIARLSKLTGLNL